MPRKRKPRAKEVWAEFVVWWLQKVVKNPKSSPAMQLKALDRIALIHRIYPVKLVEPEDETRQPEPKIDSLDEIAERMVAQVTNKAIREEKRDGIPTNNESSN
jgi:hypothetical protein